MASSSEAPELVPDVLEKILIGCTVKNLIQFKSVCKSWYSFISSPRFIESHLNHSYHNDRDNNEVGDRRIAMSKDRVGWEFYQYKVDGWYFENSDCHLLGSSNGLVCIYACPAELFVANPMTREVKKLRKIKLPYNGSFCWGFGYDLSTDDYKAVLGFKKGEDEISFKMLSLKSNTWKGVGKLKYRCTSRFGMLCNGALHWFMNDQNKNEVILSFDLSKEEFKEIPQPNDARYERATDTSLGTINDCLCIYRCLNPTFHKWVMRNYNVQESWEVLQIEGEMKYDYVHYLKNVKYDGIDKCFSGGHIRSKTWKYADAPIFVQSLVSPHVNGRAKRKRQTKSSSRSDKLIKGDLSAHGTSAGV